MNNEPLQIGDEKDKNPNGNKFFKDSHYKCSKSKVGAYNLNLRMTETQTRDDSQTLEGGAFGVEADVDAGVKDHNG